jgi:hypothetical protein
MQKVPTGADSSPNAIGILIEGPPGFTGFRLTTFNWTILYVKLFLIGFFS